MIAVYIVLVALVVLVVSAIGRRSVRGRHSIEHYHRTMDVLSEITEQRHETGNVVIRRAATSRRVNKTSTDATGLPELHDTDVRLGKPWRDRAERQHKPSLGPTAPSSFTQQADSRRGGFTAWFALLRRTLNGRDFGARQRIMIPVISLALVGIVVGLVLSGGGPVTTRRATTSGSIGRQKSAGRPTSTSNRTTRSAPTSSTTTLPSANPEMPILSSLSPEVAAAGQTLTLMGTGFTSPNGNIVATFDGQVAPTRCPSEELCIVTIPPGSKGAVTVRLQTESGRSNAVTFHYA